MEIIVADEDTTQKTQTQHHKNHNNWLSQIDYNMNNPSFSNFTISHTTSQNHQALYNNLLFRHHHNQQQKQQQQQLNSIVVDPSTLSNQSYPNLVMTPNSSSTSSSSAAVNFGTMKYMNNNNNSSISTDWLSQIYSNYFSMATQNILNGLPLGISMPFPRVDFINNINNHYLQQQQQCQQSSTLQNNN